MGEEDDDFGKALSHLFTAHDEKLGAAQKSIQLFREQQGAFIQKFRESLHDVILPLFERARGRSSGRLYLQSNNGEHGMEAFAKLETRDCALEYRIESSRQRVLLSVTNPHTVNTAKPKELLLGELTEQNVTEQIKAFLVMALGLKRE